MYYTKALLFLAPALYELMAYPTTRNHFTFWTWIFHSITILRGNSRNFYTASKLGSNFVLLGYIYCLWLNPYLEYDLVETVRFNWNSYMVWFRSFVYHVIPVIYFNIFLRQVKLSFNGVYIFQLLQLTYLTIGKVSGSIEMNPFYIYINTKSNTVTLSELEFVFNQFLISLISIGTIFILTPSRYQKNNKL